MMHLKVYVQTTRDKGAPQGKFTNHQDKDAPPGIYTNHQGQG